MKKVLIMLLGLALVSFGSIVNAANSVIADGKKVSFDYKLTVDGKVVDTSEGKKPLEYTQGKGMIIPGLEKALVGLKAGDEKSVTVLAAEGYGPVDPKAVVEVPKKNFGEGFDPKVGMMVQMKNQDGQEFAGLIKEVKTDSVMVDFNHPLAGKDLSFAIKIVSVE